ncbi:siroheme decarboxylase subunit beta [Leeia aquatica]|uniref:siroheme decarboxylase n=1 Tax=Leeia aquatica TaxID=2725557 RepID=A0A847SDF1_9NEIS|nr:Lrp/AsnC family transcriptional regulator [Leeia aquatica]NLR75198.1 Lrp/AsnC family transcriptional regulator [Leeia aquatica]
MNAPALLPLLDRYQRGFPLQPRPFAALAQDAGLDEAALLQQLAQHQQAGLLSRVGAVFAPNTVGCSTLAALALPPAQRDTVAQWISQLPEVNHNYAREHRYNLWFVLTARDRAALDRTLRAITQHCGQAPLDLPLEREYHIDLGFALGAHGPARRRTVTPASPQLDAADHRLLTALQDGLPLETQPFLSLAQRCGWEESALLQRLQAWQDSGVIRRFGFILRHHELGYRANAMCVWQVPDAQRDSIGQQLADDAAVNLCYGRPARLPHWPYNLFCMLHAADPAAAHATALALSQRHGLEAVPQAVLVSTRRYTQRGARYGHTS